MWISAPNLTQTNKETPSADPTPLAPASDGRAPPGASQKRYSRPGDLAPQVQIIYEVLVMDIISLNSITGRTLIGRILHPGDFYGFQNRLIWCNPATRSMEDPEGLELGQGGGSNKLGIEFYDSSDVALNHPLGRFTGGRYYLNTILEGASGLSLQGGQIEWDIDFEEMEKVRTWASKLGTERTESIP